MEGKGIHQVLGSCRFQWCDFHSCAFSKNSPNIQLVRFSLHNTMKTNLPKLLDLLIFCIYSLNFSLEFFIMISFVTNQLDIKVPILKEVNFGKVKLWVVEHFWTDFDLSKWRDMFYHAIC